MTWKRTTSILIDEKAGVAATAAGNHDGLHRAQIKCLPDGRYLFAADRLDLHAVRFARAGGVPADQVPPLTRSHWPVTKAERSEAKNRTAPATSSGVPMRRRAVRAMTPGLSSSGARPLSVKPGETTLTRTPRGPTSCASMAAKWIKPALAVP